jgi:hypothetical protein
MSEPLTRIERRIRFSGILVIAGLLIELVTLHWAHPTAFIFFLIFGGGLVALGIGVYLISLVAQSDKQV